MLEENTQAPNFCLLDANGESHELSKLTGKYIILYFYPRDNTPGCTQQACDFRDNLKDFDKKNCLVYGISRDSLLSHQKFATKHELNFTLLSDPELVVHKAYEVLTEENKTVRSTFLIDRNGKLLKIWPKVKVPEHVLRVITTLKDLQ